MKTEAQVLTEIATDEVQFKMDEPGVTRVFSVRAWKDFIEAVFYQLFSSVSLARVTERPGTELMLTGMLEHGRIVIRHRMMYDGWNEAQEWARSYFSWRNIMRYSDLGELYDELSAMAKKAQEIESVDIKVRTV